MKMICDKFLIIFVLLAITKAQTNKTPGKQTDLLIKDYNNEIETFKRLYVGRIDSIDIQLKMLLLNVQQLHKRLYLLERLSDFSKSCVNRHKQLLPEENSTTINIQMCSSEALANLDSLVAPCLQTRNNLTWYHDEIYEKEIQKCQEVFSSTSYDYYLCTQDAVYKELDYSSNNQVMFFRQMEAAKLQGDINVIAALNCTYVHQSDAISKTSVASTSIDGCLQGLDLCNKCDGNFCENASHLDETMMDYQNETMLNPFFGRNETLQCLMLNVVF